MNTCTCNAPFIETALSSYNGLRHTYIITRIYNSDGTVQKRSKTNFAKGGDDLKIRCSRCGFEIIDFEEFIQ